MTMTDNETRVEMTLGAGLFRDLARVASAAATDSARPALTHVQFTKRGNVIEAIATDSYRLAIATWIGDAGAEGGDGSADVEILIPAKLMASVAAAAKKVRGIGEVRVVANGRHLLFSVGDQFVQGGDAYEGDYPKMAHILETWKAGELGSISFNGDFLAGANSVVPDCRPVGVKPRRHVEPPITIRLPETANQAAKFTTACPVHGVDFTYLLMPVRIS